MSSANQYDDVITTSQTQQQSVPSEELAAIMNELSRFDTAPLVINIEKETLSNTDYRRIIHTTLHNQVVLMSLKPGEVIDREIHPTVTQFMRIESGDGWAELKVPGRKVARVPLGDGTAINVPPGTEHFVDNSKSKRPLKIYIIYSPFNHIPGLTQHSKPTPEESARDEQWVKSVRPGLLSAFPQIKTPPTHPFQSLPL